MKVDHSVFEDASVNIADADYSNCTFRRCTLIVDGRPVTAVGNVYDSCNIEVVGPAANAIGIVSEFCKMSPEMAMSVAKALGIASDTKH